ncbi:hypothetical protein [Winogradskyella sp. A3E31]|uniref:dioxygenase family protein n=1 Tax=Winogradskyella sp. A3E31 TaxID=3349637 RepID=UPI00398AE307
MKTLKLLVLVACILSAVALSAQNVEISPTSEFALDQLDSEATITDYDSQDQKLKITGTVFKSDGVTPAKDVIIYIDQANADGEYIYEENDKIKHRTAIKTDANGNYTFYTFVPGSAYIPMTYPKRLGMKTINMVVKAPGTLAYDYDPYVFADDPLMTKRCLKRLKKKHYTGILIPELNGDILEAHRNIVLDVSYAMK